MTILTIKTGETGMAGVVPRTIYIDTDDTEATIVTTGYLNGLVRTQGLTLSEKEMALVNSTDAGLIWLAVAKSGQDWSLVYPEIKLPPGNDILSTSVSDPDLSPNLVTFDTTITFSQLALGAAPIVFQGSGLKDYHIRNLWINRSATSFSGGDRNISLESVSTQYSLIPAATLSAVPNAAWGSTALPFPLGASRINTPIIKQNLVAIYGGGSTDYTAGEITITGLMERTL